MKVNGRYHGIPDREPISRIQSVWLTDPRFPITLSKLGYSYWQSVKRLEKILDGFWNSHGSMLLTSSILLLASSAVLDVFSTWDAKSRTDFRLSSRVGNFHIQNASKFGTENEAFWLAKLITRLGI